VFVSLDLNGLPKILPLVIRTLIIDRDFKMVRVILTIVQIYRVFPTTPKVDLKAILDPFNGLSRTLDTTLITESVAELIKTPLVLPKLNFVLLTTSSPTSVKSTLGMSLDTIALIFHPKQLYLCLKLSGFSIVSIIF
jgi:hypothetical protein